MRASRAEGRGGGCESIDIARRVCVVAPRSGSESPPPSSAIVAHDCRVGNGHATMTTLATFTTATTTTTTPSRRRRRRRCRLELAIATCNHVALGLGPAALRRTKRAALAFVGAFVTAFIGVSALFGTAFAMALCLVPALLLLAL